MLKFARLKPLRDDKAFTFLEADIADREAMLALADQHPDSTASSIWRPSPACVIRLVDPYVYVQTNVMGHLVMLELARRLPDAQAFRLCLVLVGLRRQPQAPFAVADRVDHPISLYAATKRADELMTETYVHLHKLKATGLRYFTVYGPWGRPDMSPYIFAKAIHEGATDRALSPGRDEARFQLYRRYRRGHARRARQAGGGSRPPPLQSRRVAQRGHPAR